MLFGEFLSSRLEYPLLISFIFLFLSSCSTSEILETKKTSSRFLSVEKELMHVAPEERSISNLQFSHRSKIIIWMHGTKRPAVASNHNCTDDMPPESLTLAAKKLNFSLYYLCSRAVDGREKGSFIYKRVDELEKKNSATKSGRYKKRKYICVRIFSWWLDSSDGSKKATY